MARNVGAGGVPWPIKRDEELIRRYGNRLAPRRRAFALEYVKDWDAKNAAIRAGYKPTSAAAMGKILISKPEIQEWIKEELDRMMSKIEITNDRILEELAYLAFSDTTKVAKVVNGQVLISETANLTEDERRAIAEVSETTTQHGGTIKVKHYDKLRALEMLMKYKGMLSNPEIEDENCPMPVQVQIQVVDGRRKPDSNPSPELEEVIPPKTKSGKAKK